MTKNPFKVLLHELGTNTLLVTIDYLDAIKKLFYAFDVEFVNYSQVFEMLEYLQQHGCLNIKQRGDGSYTITGLHNYGE